MKDDRLEKFIIENHDEFDSYEPGPNVWENIKLREEKPKLKKLNLTTFLWRVAAIAVILVSVYAFVKIQFLNEPDSLVAVVENIDSNNDGNNGMREIVIPELIEAEAYYASMISIKMAEVKKFAASYPELESEIVYDFNELDSVCAELKKDLNDNIDNEEIINAMIQNYRLKVEILEDMLNYLQESSDDKNEDTNESPMI